MSEINEIFRQFNHGNGEWKQFIKSITISNIHGWNGQKMELRFPVIAVVGENGVGKSTFLKAAVCAYKNKSGCDFYPSQMFRSTQWDETALNGAVIEYDVRIGDSSKKLKWKKTKDWGFSPKKNNGKPSRNVYFLDISRTLPLDATAGYANIAKKASAEAGHNKELNDESIDGLKFVLGQNYTKARFTGTDFNPNREVGLLTKEYGEISQFHQGAGEDAILDLFLLLQEIPTRSLLVIDEVENSLHPQAQRRLVQYLLKLARKKKLQIILSTHSPFVLEELPLQARVMLVNLRNHKDILYNISSNYALSTIDENNHPDLYVYCEDEEAITFFWEILKQYSDRYDEFLKRIFTKAVGSYSVVSTLNTYAKEDKLPVPSVSIVDGDKRDECPDCMSLPGNLAPERMVFQDLQELDWKNLDDRFGHGAGTLFKILDDAMLRPDHHEWTTYVGDMLHKSKDYVWSVMVEEWCKHCLSDSDAKEFVDSISEKLDSL